MHLGIQTNNELEFILDYGTEKSRMGTVDINKFLV